MISVWVGMFWTCCGSGLRIGAAGIRDAGNCHLVSVESVLTSRFASLVCFALLRREGPHGFGGHVNVSWVDYHGVIDPPRRSAPFRVFSPPSGPAPPPPVPPCPPFFVAC